MNRLVLAVLVLVITVQGAFAAAMSNPGGRSFVSLDGMWNAIVDPYETGLNAKFFNNAKPKSKSDLIEYDFDRAGQLRVPGDWNTQRESLLFYEGPIWYQKNFSYQKREHTRVFVNFGAANYQARVWLNGAKLGEHTGGFTPFQFEITDQLAVENSLVIEVDNTRHAEAVPSLNSDWWNYGGLTREVKLIEVPDTFIENYSVQLARGTANTIDGWVKLNGSGAGRDVAIEIPEADLKQTARPDASGRAAFHFPAKLDLWSPENPKLYRVVISAGDDHVTEEIGFRTIESRGTQILLNGKPVFLRGICVHEEAPFRSGRAFSEEDDRTLLTWAKELGGNFVRLAHYPHNEEMIRLADRMGLLVWEEVPVYWSIAWQNPATLENAKSQLREVIARDRNRAAVILWSLSNETPPNEAGRTEFLKSMLAEARQLDSTRLITSAMNRAGSAGPDTRVLNDPLGEFVDVFGFNQYIGWYEGKPEDADRVQWQNPFHKPLIVSEFGAGAPYGMHGDTATRFSEEFQANVFEHQIAMLKKIPDLAGMSPWLLMDFRSPRRLLPGVQDYYNRKGVISDRGQRKQAFYVLQKFYKDKAKAGQ